VSQAPHPLSPLLLVVLHDEPKSVSRLPQDFAQQWRAHTTAGRTPTARIAERLGVPIAFADDPEVPADHDLLLLAGAGRGLTSSAARVACTHLNAEPQAAVGYGSGISDVDWMRKVVEVRTAAQSESALPEPIAMMATILADAAQKNVPVLLDGVVAAAAAAVAAASPELQAPVLGEEPAQQLFLDHLGIGAWGTSGIGPGLGLGGLFGLSLLTLALLAEEQ
jgi:nicotinate-nucleotide--dimethylbenzimidazole phosphoribosyltransferase